jgi:hypothetical protein
MFACSKDEKPDSVLYPFKYSRASILSGWPGAVVVLPFSPSTLLNMAVGAKPCTFQTRL